MQMELYHMHLAPPAAKDFTRNLEREHGTKTMNMNNDTFQNII